MSAKIHEIVNNRPVALILQGSSINELENRIESFRDLDICWVALGLFTTVEKFILAKINKQIDIVFDCSSAPDSKRRKYETTARLPRLNEFLSRPKKNLWITTNGIVRDSIKLLDQEWFLMKHQSKMFIVDELFPKSQIASWMSVPNSATLCIASLLSVHPKSLVIFGLDGFRSPVAEDTSSYYKPEYVKIDRQLALGSLEDPGINRDTDAFEKEFPYILQKYRTLFGCQTPIFNCSPGTLYTFPKVIDYNEVVPCLT